MGLVRDCPCTSSIRELCDKWKYSWSTAMACYTVSEPSCLHAWASSWDPTEKLSTRTARLSGIRAIPLARTRTGTFQETPQLWSLHITFPCSVTHHVTPGLPGITVYTNKKPVLQYLQMKCHYDTGMVSRESELTGAHDLSWEHSKSYCQPEPRLFCSWRCSRGWRWPQGVGRPAISGGHRGGLGPPPHQWGVPHQAQKALEPPCPALQ